MDISAKLTKLRGLMNEHQLDFYYVPSADAHNNEYVPDYWDRRAWISGFTGSAGDVVIGTDNAHLWTDGRYTLQAEQQLDENHFQLMQRQQGGTTSIDLWLIENTPGKRIGVDPKVMSSQTAKRWNAILSAVGGELVFIEDNLVDQSWDDQPTPSNASILRLSDSYSGQATAQKLQLLRAELKELQVDAHIITMLDAIAWLFNIRGRDIAYNPLVISYAIVTQSEAILFIDSKKLNTEDNAYFTDNSITIAEYGDFCHALNQATGTVLVDNSTASQWIEQQLLLADIAHGPSPITLLKAIKNPVEQAGMAEAHRRDGLAICKFLHWLDNNWQGQTEMSAANQLEAFRREDDHLQGLSFNTISGYGAHGAIIHYAVTPETDIPLNNTDLFLVDSGGQYLEGTTDITRTLHLGTPNAQEKKHYTLVLKGHLALGNALFPLGTRGEHIDALARAPLWAEGLNYSHGTGHGVGCFLCVHEGPQRISGATTNTPLQDGMIVSNEPGVYLEGQYGIRIENLCLIEEKISEAAAATDHGPFLGMTNLTVVPYARHLIDTTLLSNDEIQQIDTYHQQVYDLLHKDLQENVKEWLHKATQPLTS